MEVLKAKITANNTNHGHNYNCPLSFLPEEILPYPHREVRGQAVIHC